MKIIHPIPAHRNSRKTLCASGFEHSNSQDNSDEKLMVSLAILTYKMTTIFSDKSRENTPWQLDILQQWRFDIGTTFHYQSSKYL